MPYAGQVAEGLLKLPSSILIALSFRAGERPASRSGCACPADPLTRSSGSGTSRTNMSRPAFDLCPTHEIAKPTTSPVAVRSVSCPRVAECYSGHPLLPIEGNRQSPVLSIWEANCQLLVSLAAFSAFAGVFRGPACTNGGSPGGAQGIGAGRKVGLRARSSSRTGPTPHFCKNFLACSIPVG